MHALFIQVVLLHSSVMRFFILITYILPLFCCFSLVAALSLPSNYSAPTPPAGFRIAAIFDEKVPLDPVAFYVNAMEAVAS